MKKQSLMLAKLSVLAVATCLSAGTASAQPMLKGTFTLPYEVRWGKALLPAGQYTIVVDSSHRPALVSTASGAGRAYVTAQVVNEASQDQPTALLITQGETERTVRSLNWLDGNKSFVYKAFSKAERKQLAQSNGAEMVAIRMARN